MSLLSRLSSTVRSPPATPRCGGACGASDAPRCRRRAAARRRDRAGSGQRPTSRVDSRADGSAALADRRPGVPLRPSYDPHEDDRPDPGEIVWAWVHYEEDTTRGKDRPVLVLAEEDAAVGGTDGSGTVLVSLMLTSRDRTEAGATRTDEHGATWVDIGAGDWDRQGRPSEVRADRLLRLSPAAVRREGARLDRERFDRVVAAVRATS